MLRHTYARHSATASAPLLHRHATVSATPSRPRRSLQCRDSKGPNLGDDLLDYVMAGPKMRKWWVALAAYLPRSSQTIMHAPIFDVVVLREQRPCHQRIDVMHPLPVSAAPMCSMLACRVADNSKLNLSHAHPRFLYPEGMARASVAAGHKTAASPSRGSGPKMWLGMLFW